MATVYLTFGRSGVKSRNGVTKVMIGPFRSETVASSGTAASGALVAATSEIVKIFCATAIYVKAGAGVTASTGIYIPAGVVEYIGVDAGQVVSVIDA